jgi:type I restriction enzyme S subunit
MTGTSGRQRVPAESIAAFEVTLPPLFEQRKIASILGALDDKIELNRRMNTTLEAMARTLFQSWFVDFDPVHAKAEGRQPVGMDAETAALFPDSFEDSALGPIPQGWEVVTLGNVLTELETGRRPKGGVASFASGIPSVGAESINGIGVFDYAKTRYVPEEFYERNTSGRIRDFDVLLYKDGGKPGEFRPRVGMYGLGFPFVKFSINEHVFRMRTERLGQAFLYFLVSSHRVLEDFANKGGKAAIPGINQPDVKSTLLVHPSKQLLERYNDLSLQFCERILRYASESQSLSEVRDNLLPQLLSGELRVGDVAG